jgi:hypothetical protein
LILFHAMYLARVASLLYLTYVLAMILRSVSG